MVLTVPYSTGYRVECSTKSCLYRFVLRRSFVGHRLSDDLFHPLRIEGFRNCITDPGRVESCGALTPFALGCKILLSEDMGAKDGVMDRLIKHEQDFSLWQRDPSLRGRVTLVTEANYSHLDAEEYFDYAVPARVLHDFLELTPTNISSSLFCDLRFYEYLRKLICTDAGAFAPMLPCPWLLAQYKVPQAEKRRFFDAGGVYGDHASDQASVSFSEVCEEDEELAQAFSRMPGQIAMIRGYIESIVIQYVAWNPRLLEMRRKDKVAEISRNHGPGLADRLWDAAVAKFSMPADLAEKNAAALASLMTRDYKVMLGL